MLTKFLRAATNAKNLVVSFIGSTIQTNSSNTTHTLTSASIGAANVNRRVVVTVGTVGTSGSDTVNTVTVGGVSLTKHIEVSGAVGVAIFSEVITTGTTATIVVTTSASSNIAVRVFNVVGAPSVYNAGSSASNTTTSIISSPNLTVGYLDVGVYAVSQQSTNSLTIAVSVGTSSFSSNTTFTANTSRRTGAGRITYDTSSSTATVTLTGDASTLKNLALATFTPA